MLPVLHTYRNIAYVPIRLFVAHFIVITETRPTSEVSVASSQRIRTPSDSQGGLAIRSLHVTVQVTYKYINQYVQDTLATNVYIAAFTTSNARLRLYDMLNKLGQSVAYYDTDSIVYIDNGENTIKTGEWNDEIRNNSHIKEWYWTGPNSYGYITSTGQEVVKAKPLP